MTKNVRLFIAIILVSFNSLPAFSQWTQRQSLGGMPRTFATGFTISNTIYLMGGYDGNATLFDDVWAYNPVTDTWTQKANFPGGTRSASTSFTIGSKGYMGTGVDGNTYLRDFWEYEPTTDSWTQKADFPGYEREEAVGFSIGNIGYLGTGQTFVITPNSSFTTTYNDFYGYDPSTDSWTQKDSLPGAPRAYAVGAVIGNKGYIGLGGNDDQSLSYTDFYEYDPIIDNWTSKASMGGNGRADAGIVAVGNNIYVIGGINFPNFTGFNSCRKYDVITDTWTNGPFFTGGVIIAPVVQNANNRVFAGTGYYGSILPRNDWWEFTSIATSIENVDFNQTQVYPNPFSNELNVNLNGEVGEIKIEIVDELGKLVFMEQEVASSPERKTIHTNELSKGIYFLYITNSKGAKIVSQKIVKG